MKICHVCGAKCPEEADLCPTCGAELADATKEVEIEIDNPVLAASVPDLVTAEIFCDMLKENGIPFALGEQDDDIEIKLTFGGRFIAEEIYVDEKNLDAAQNIYAEIQENEPEFLDFGDEETDAE